MILTRFIKILLEFDSDSTYRELIPPIEVLRHVRDKVQEDQPIIR